MKYSGKRAAPLNENLDDLAVQLAETTTLEPESAVITTYLPQTTINQSYGEYYLMKVDNRYRQTNYINQNNGYTWFISLNYMHL